MLTSAKACILLIANKFEVVKLKKKGIFIIDLRDLSKILKNEDILTGIRIS